MTQGYPSPQPGPPASQPGHPQQGGYVPPPLPQRGASKGWLIFLFLVALFPTVFSRFSVLFMNMFEASSSWLDVFFVSYWDSAVATWFINVVRLVCGMSAVAVLFGSSAGRWILVSSSAIMLVNAAAGIAVSASDSELKLGLFDIFYVPILVVAFLPPVNRAFRKVPQAPMAYGQPVPQQGGYPQQPPIQPQQQQQPPPQQPGYGQPPQAYPQQQWQQGPPR